MLFHVDHEHLYFNSLSAHRPLLHMELCQKCGTCAELCRHHCIVQLHNGYYEALSDHCVGCGVCAQVCPSHAIELVEIGGIAVLA